MPAQMLDHVNILCTDLEKSRDFYHEVLGFRVGWRPEVADLPGYWLYLGDVPCIHLSRLQDLEKMSRRRNVAPGDGTGPLDHVGFRCTGFDDVRARLERQGVPYSENEVPFRGDVLRQIRVHDPDGIMVELNFFPSSGADRDGRA